MLLLLRLSGRMYRANNPRGRYHRHIEEKAGLRPVDLQPEGRDALPPLLVKKIRWYMVELLETGRLLVLLREKPLTAREEKALILLGGIMAVYDSLVDEQDDPGLPGKVLGRFIRKENFDGGKGWSGTEKVFHVLSEAFFSAVTEEQWLRFTRHFGQINYQLLSGRQKNERISEKEVLDLTYGKGGASLLLCLSLLFPPDKKLEQAMFSLGGLIQLLNDAQDLHKDAVKGITTFVRFKKSFGEIIETIEEQENRTFGEFYPLSAEYRQTSRFLFCIHALTVAVKYKILAYRKNVGEYSDYDLLGKMDREYFRVDPFSQASVRYCVPKILFARL